MGVVRSQRASFDVLFILLSDFTWKMLRTSDSSSSSSSGSSSSSSSSCNNGRLVVIHEGRFDVTAAGNPGKEELFDTGCALWKPAGFVHQNEIFLALTTFRMERIRVDGLHLRSTTVEVSVLPLDHASMNSDPKGLQDFCVLPGTDYFGQTCIAGIVDQCIETFVLKNTGQGTLKEGPFTVENISNLSTNARVFAMPAYEGCPARFKGSVILLSEEGIVVTNDTDGSSDMHCASLIPELCALLPAEFTLFFVDSDYRLWMWDMRSPESPPRLKSQLASIVPLLTSYRRKTKWFESICMVVPLDANHLFFCNRAGPSAVVSVATQNASVVRRFQSAAPLHAFSFADDGPQSVMLSRSGMVGLEAVVLEELASSDPFLDGAYSCFIFGKGEYALFSSRFSSFVLSLKTFSEASVSLSLESETIWMDDSLQITTKELRAHDVVSSPKIVAAQSQMACANKMFIVSVFGKSLTVFRRSSVSILSSLEFASDICGLSVDDEDLLVVTFWDFSVLLYSLANLSRNRKEALIRFSFHDFLSASSLCLCRSIAVFHSAQDSAVTVACGLQDGSLIHVSVAYASGNNKCDLSKIVAYRLGHNPVILCSCAGLNAFIAFCRGENRIFLVDGSGSITRLSAPSLKHITHLSYAEVAQFSEKAFVVLDAAADRRLRLSVHSAPISTLPSFCWTIPEQYVDSAKYWFVTRLDECKCIVGVRKTLSSAGNALSDSEELFVFDEVSGAKESMPFPSKLASGNALNLSVLGKGCLLALFSRSGLLFAVSRSEKGALVVEMIGSFQATQLESGPSHPDEDPLEFVSTASVLSNPYHIALAVRDQLFVVNVEPLVRGSGNVSVVAKVELPFGQGGYRVASFGNRIAVALLFDELQIFELASRGDEFLLTPLCRHRLASPISAILWLSSDQLLIADHSFDVAVVALEQNSLASTPVAGEIVQDSFSLLWRELLHEEQGVGVATDDDIRWELLQRTAMPLKTSVLAKTHCGLLVNWLSFGPSKMGVQPLCTYSIASGSIHEDDPQLHHPIVYGTTSCGSVVQFDIASAASDAVLKWTKSVAKDDVLCCVVERKNKF
eukprot:ANDGO_06991.mRNA.1 hypothetical protein